MYYCTSTVLLFIWLRRVFYQHEKTNYHYRALQPDYKERTMCQITSEIAQHVNADNQAIAEMEMNESAVADLFIDERADFSNGEIELWETVDKAFEDEQELIKSLVFRVATNDLTANTELRLLLTGIAAQQNEAMAISH